MKLRLFAQILTSLAIALSAVATIPDPSKAESDKYFCAVLHSIPRTFVRTQRGNVAMISWVTQVSQEWFPVRRCVEVSKRFQRLHDNGTLRDIGTGIINGYPVLCGVRSQGNACNSRNLLVTLHPRADRYEAARNLLDIGTLASGRSLYLSGDRKLETYMNGENYYNLDVIEEIAPTVEEALTPVDTY